jgi:hypothetical protein
MLRASVAVLSLFLAVATGVTTAHAGRRAVEVVRVPAWPMVRGVGCYWERGVQYCARYCYIEFNGRQYCQERLRHAHPQAPFAQVPPYHLPLKD